MTIPTIEIGAGPDLFRPGARVSRRAGRKVIAPNSFAPMQKAFSSCVMRFRAGPRTSAVVHSRGRKSPIGFPKASARQLPTGRRPTQLDVELVMQTITRVAGRTLAKSRGADQRVGLVPTMGYLHDGHMALIAASRAQCHVTVVSIFVNPTQVRTKRGSQHLSARLQCAVVRRMVIDLNLPIEIVTTNRSRTGWARNDQSQPLSQLRRASAGPCDQSWTIRSARRISLGRVQRRES
ncbi:hypothetical protein GGD62_007707 [Bradyrhizobium sp. ERR14]|nr:hypothetical protein [Bradyrhizobium sp. ERR14]